MSNAIKAVAAAFAFLTLVYLLGFLATGGDLAIYQFWAPKRANAERQVFEHSQSYVEGKIANLQQLCHSASVSDGAQKAAFLGEIRDEAATVSVGALPADEQACVRRAQEPDGDAAY